MIPRTRRNENRLERELEVWRILGKPAAPMYLAHPRLNWVMRERSLPEGAWN